MIPPEAPASQPEAARPRPLLARALRATRVALGFLTVIPMNPRGDALTDADLADSRFAYPVAGAAIGLVLAGLSEGLRRAGVPATLSAFLLVAAGVVVSGGLHLDGLADSFDGLFLGGDPDRRLSVMRDPHVGSFGVSAIVVTLLGRYAALEALDDVKRVSALFAAATVSRTLILVSAGMANYARREGTGRILIDATSRRDAFAAAAAVVVVATAATGRSGLVAGVATLLLASGITRIAMVRLGGITGDTLGALVELGELTFLVTLGVT